MANRFQIRSGSSTPSSLNLLDKELGYNVNDKKLYINNNGSIQEVTSATIEKIIAIPQTTGSTLVITDLNLTDTCSVFIDIDFSKNPTVAQVKAFREADLVYSTNTTTSLTLKVNGKSDVATTGVPIQITVVY